MKDSPMMIKREIDFMKKKGAPKAMIKHEIAEAKAMKPKKMACGGEVKRGYGKARGGC